MNLFLDKFLSTMPCIAPPTQVNGRISYSTSMNGPDKDVFEKSTSSVSPTFASKKSRGSNSSTSAGKCLKELDNITCPYSGVKMIPSKKMDVIERQLAQCNSVGERMEILDSYRKCMQPLEKSMYSIFCAYEMNNPKGSLNDCLQKLKPDALVELRLEEFQVLDEVDKLSNQVDARTAFEIRTVTTEARKKILEDKQDQIFKRKDLLAALYNVTKDYPDQGLIEQMWETASRLPKSTTNINAFIVKYSKRSPQEIAARLLRPSVASIEHIDPASVTGKNSLTNFMLAARDWNSSRGNMPLPEFIKEHPKIPDYSQRYVNDIIKAIHKGKLKDADWYPYVLKEKLYSESDGLIDLDISKYCLTEAEAFMDAPDDVMDTYMALREKSTEIIPADDNSTSAE